MTTATHTITCKDLKTAMARVDAAIDRRSSIAVLACVRIGDGMLTATNMECTLSVPLPAATFESVLASAADVKRVLSACKPGDSIELERVAGAPASGWIEPIVHTVNYTTPGRFTTPAVFDSLALETPNGRVELPGFDMEDWPKLPDVNYSESFAPADPSTFASVLQDVAKHASSDESRPVLCSTLIESFPHHARIVATDSYRLGLDIEHGEGDTFTAHAPMAGKYLAKFADIVTIERAESGSHVRFTDAAGVTCTLRHTEGNYPSVDQLIPAVWEHRVDVPAGMAAAVKFAGKTACERNNPLRLAFDADGFEMSASVLDGAKTSKRFDAYESSIGEHLTIGFNAGFLQDGLAFVGDDSALDLISALRPGLLVSKVRESRVYLIMPVRLPE